MINKIFKNKQLPDIISNELIQGLSILFNIEQVEITSKEIIQHLFRDEEYTDFESFSKRLEELNQKISGMKNREILKIKLKENE